jgi:predicted  nucleic acid-binding Zn-ribbon protein
MTKNSGPTPAQILETLVEVIRLDDAGDAGDADRRRALITRLPREHAEHYARLVKAGRRPAVAAVTDGHCARCHMRVPPQLQLVAARGEVVCRCPSCQRFLLMAETADLAPGGNA